MNKYKTSLYYFQELKYRLYYTLGGITCLFAISYTYKQELIYSLLPYGLSHFVATELTEVFFTYLHVCVTFSVTLGCCILLTQLYIFLRPGLHKYESRLYLNFLISFILFYICLYVFVLPILFSQMWEYFSTYSSEFLAADLNFEPKLNDYLRSLMVLHKILSVTFPCLVLFNLIQRYVNKKILMKYRNIAYINILIASAFMTPPDIFSQIFISLIIIFYYELQMLYFAFYQEYTKILLSEAANQKLQEYLRKE